MLGLASTSYESFFLVGGLLGMDPIGRVMAMCTYEVLCDGVGHGWLDG